MWGSNNEMLIFPILELIKKEVKGMIRRGEITIDQMYESASGSGGNILVSKDDNSNKIVLSANLLNKLESNDFELELEKKDPDNPKLLTGVVIKFSDELLQIMSLVRQGGKLINVKMSIIVREPKFEKIDNPLAMGGDDFAEYVRNKRLYGYFDSIYNDPTSTPEEKELATQKKDYLSVRNQEIRNVYGITMEADLSLDELMSYMNNPLGMNAYDYVEYCRNARAWSFPDATQEQRDDAHESSVSLREKYGILEDEAGAFPLSFLAEFLKNPLGMHAGDYNEYVKTRQTIDSLDPSDIVQANQIRALEESNKAVADSYFIEDTFSTAQLEAYLGLNDTSYFDKTLFRILISLFYSSEGKLEKVKSETLGGDE